MRRLLSQVLSPFLFLAAAMVSGCSGEGWKDVVRKPEKAVVVFEESNGYIYLYNERDCEPAPEGAGKFIHRYVRVGFEGYLTLESLYGTYPISGTGYISTGEVDVFDFDAGWIGDGTVTISDSGVKAKGRTDTGNKFILNYSGPIEAVKAVKEY